MRLRIGSRSSPLALKQVEIFTNHINASCDYEFEVVKVKTSGDKITDKPLYDIGGKALFLKELETELTEGRIDIAIHSLKDVPGLVSDEFRVGCFVGRDYVLDAFISKKYKNISALPQNAKVGTCSPRRIIFLKKLRPDLDICLLRGNIGSRLDRLYNGEYDAIILAEAGIRRLDLWDNDYCHSISPDVIIPSVGQGVIAAQILSHRKDLSEIFDKFEDAKFQKEISFEREFLKQLSADCDSPVAAYVQIESGSYLARFMYAQNMKSEPKILEEKLNQLDLNVAREIASKILH